MALWLTIIVFHTKNLITKWKKLSTNTVNKRIIQNGQEFMPIYAHKKIKKKKKKKFYEHLR